MIDEVAQIVGRDPEHVEVRLVARVVDARDHLRDAVLLLRELADDEVVLVVAGDREHEVGGALDPGRLEDVELGRVAVVDVEVELLLEPAVAVEALLDQRHLVVRADQRARHVGADLAAARDDRRTSRRPLPGQRRRTGRRR